MSLLLIHGAGGTHKLWDRLVKEMEEVPFNTICIDLPGHGDSESVDIRTISDYADLVCRFIESFAIKQVVIGGHSMGGAIAMQVALGQPSWLKGLVIISSGARLRVEPGFLAGLKKHERSAISMMGTFGFAQEADPAMIQLFIDEIAKGDPEILYRDFDACNQFDIMNRVREINVPALVCCGNADILAPLKYSTFLVEKLPHGRMEVIKAAGHLLPLEQPRELARQVKSFMEKMA